MDHAQGHKEFDALEEWLVKRGESTAPSSAGHFVDVSANSSQRFYRLAHGQLIAPLETRHPLRHARFRSSSERIVE
jgi:hypothetical protein